MEVFFIITGYTFILTHDKSKYAFPGLNILLFLEDGEKKTLSESAKEYTDNHESNKRKYEVEMVLSG